MNKRGQTAITIGGFIGIFVLVVVGIALFQGSAGQIGTAVNTVDSGNVTITMPLNGVTLDLTGQDLLSSMIVTNATGGEVVPTSNYTAGEGVSTTTGVKTVQITGAGGSYAGTSVNVSYTYGADGYINNSGGRSLANLILIFFALAIAVIVLVPTLKSGLFK